MFVWEMFSLGDIVAGFTISVCSRDEEADVSPKRLILFKIIAANLLKVDVGDIVGDGVGGSDGASELVPETLENTQTLVFVLQVSTVPGFLSSHSLSFYVLDLSGETVGSNQVQFQLI